VVLFGWRDGCMKSEGDVLLQVSESRQLDMLKSMCNIVANEATWKLELGFPMTQRRIYGRKRLRWENHLPMNLFGRQRRRVFLPMQMKFFPDQSIIEDNSETMWRCRLWKLCKFAAIMGSCVAEEHTFRLCLMRQWSRRPRVIFSWQGFLFGSRQP